MIEPEDILVAMGNAAKTVCSKVYPQTRPNATTTKLQNFIVVSLPYAESNKTVGEDDDWWLDMTVSFEIFVADNKTASSPNQYANATMKSLRTQLKGVFPIIDENREFKITRPRVVVIGSSDDNGYHYSRIQAKMTTMV